MKPNMWITRTALAVALAMLWFSPAVVRAQDDDPPGRVARMNYVEGAVSFQPGGEGDWLTAVPNRPLTSGDNVWTDRGSRAELHVGSTALHLGPESSLTFLDLNDRALQLRLAQGSLVVRVRHLDDEDTFEVDTPNLAFTILRTGEYRIDVNPAGDTTVITDWQGQGEVTGGGYSFRVLAGQRARFTGTDDLRHDLESIAAYDAFENWAVERDRREDRLASASYISEEMTGYDDLDDYGQWNYVADYGNVWVPRGLPQGWAPYRYGHWVWVAPWGWTWVEDEPWGFAPFHYGRWANGPTGWFWVPGPVVVRPVYAPALVAFVGGVGFELAGGPAVAWFPLAPGEVFVPSYRVSRTYVEQVNITNTRVNVTQVTNVYNTFINNSNTRIAYRNQRLASAVTAVSREAFVNARPVAKSLVRVDERQLAEARATHLPPAQPTRASVMGAGGQAKARPPAEVERRQVVASRAPATPRPVFGEQSPGERPNPRSEAPAQPMPEARNVPRPPDTNRDAAPEQPPPDRTRGTDRNPAPRPPDVNRGEQPAAPAADRTRGPDRNPAPRPPDTREEPNQQGWSHPLAKPAPPVKERSPQQSQQEEQKVREWQQHQAPPAHDNPPPRGGDRPQGSEPPHNQQ